MEVIKSWWRVSAEKLAARSLDFFFDSPFHRLFHEFAPPLHARSSTEREWQRRACGTQSRASPRTLQIGLLLDVNRLHETSPPLLALKASFCSKLALIAAKRNVPNPAHIPTRPAPLRASLFDHRSSVLVTPSDEYNFCHKSLSKHEPYVRHGCTRIPLCWAIFCLSLPSIDARVQSE